MLALSDGRVVQFGKFLQEERIVGIVLAQPVEFLARFSDVLVAKIVKSQQYAGKWRQKTAMIGNQLELFYALFLVSFEAIQAEKPSNRRSLATNDVFAHSGSDVGVIVIG